MAKITSLCLSGGGPSLIKQIGILQTLEKNNIWKIDDIKSIFSTSAGSLLSVILLLRIEWNIIIDYMIKRPWNDCINMSPFQLFYIYNNKGLFDIQIIEIFFKPLFLSKNISLEITLLEFYDITKKELFFYTFEINNFETIELSHKTQPNLKLFQALYMTCCIPFLCKPYIIENKCYIDGGISLNYPIKQCIINNTNKDEILSIKNTFTNSMEYKNIDETTNTLDFINIFISKFIKILNDTESERQPENESENESENEINEILCDNKNMTLNYLADVIYCENVRNELLNDGINIGKKYLHNIINGENEKK